MYQGNLIPHKELLNKYENITEIYNDMMSASIIYKAELKNENKVAYRIN